MAFISSLPVISPPHRSVNTCRRVRTPVASQAPPGEKKQQSQQQTVAKPIASNPTPRLSNLQVVLERLGDTLLDARIHYGRLFSSKPPPTGGLRVVVLGTGWAAHSLVKVIDVSGVSSVTVISPRNFFFFTPLLSATAVGTVEFRSIVEPIRKANPYIQYFEASATDIDTNGQLVHCVCTSEAADDTPEARDTPDSIMFDVAYDVLVVAVGEKSATFNVPGARENAYFLKEISDARKLRSNLLDCLERASLPIWTPEERMDLLRFVVVGGGPTGCEFAGELSDFVSKDLAPRYGAELVSMIRVTLLQSGKTLLNQFESSLQEVALRSFRGRVEVQFGARVTRVTDTKVFLQSGDIIRYGLLVWAAGNSTRPIVSRLLQSIGAPERTRKLPVDSWLRVQGARNIFALGDCAQMEEEPLPSTAQVAGQQGAFLGRMLFASFLVSGLLAKAEPNELNREGAPILRDSGGKEINPFRFLSLGIMAYIGNDKAVVQVEATRTRNLKIGGRLAYALWRSVYAVKQVDVRNRVLVLFDYFKSRVYGRDISQF